MVAAEAGSGKLGSELRHGTDKPMMVLYKDEGDGVVTLVLLEKNVEANLASEVEGCMLCVEATSKTWKWVAWLSIEGGRCDEVVENEL